jgi:hypothetical protein
MVLLKNNDYDIIFIVNLLHDFPRLGPNALKLYGTTMVHYLLLCLANYYRYYLSFCLLVTK